MSSMSHATFYRNKAAEKDKFPALILDADAKAETFRYTFSAPERLRSNMRRDLADVFNKTFSQPAKLKSPSTVIKNVGRFGDRLEKLVHVYSQLDTQEGRIAELVMAIGDNNFELVDRMEELARLGHEFRKKLEEIRNAGSFPRTAGPEFDPRVRVLVLHLETIYQRYFYSKITSSKSIDGTFKGPFITFCRAACEHFLGDYAVSKATLEQAVLWVATRP